MNSENLFFEIFAALGNRTDERLINALSSCSTDLGLTCTTQHQLSKVGIATTNLCFARYELFPEFEGLTDVN